MGGTVMQRTSDGYYKNRHSCFLLQYHLVLVTKYRHKVIAGALEQELVTYTHQYFHEREMPILEMSCMPDHVHILFEAPPQIDLSVFVNAYKSASSRHIRKMFVAELAPYYWKPYFWSLSYFIGSVSQNTLLVVQKYIQSQKG